MSVFVLKRFYCTLQLESYQVDDKVQATSTGAKSSLWREEHTMGNSLENELNRHSTEKNHIVHLQCGQPMGTWAVAVRQTWIYATREHNKDTAVTMVIRSILHCMHIHVLMGQTVPRATRTTSAQYVMVSRCMPVAGGEGGGGWIAPFAGRIFAWCVDSWRSHNFWFLLTIMIVTPHPCKIPEKRNLIEEYHWLL